jgi:glycosyltransferase involved in cell wall biosynthesis
MAFLISCVIPVYNGEHFVAEAVESVLAQTFGLVEVVVIDDGSTDQTPRVLSSFGDRIKVISQANAGQSAARNRGIQAAAGELIAFLDADDLWLPEKLALQMARLAENPVAEACTCLIENFWEAGLAEEAERLRNTVHGQQVVALWTGLLVRRAVFERIGGPDSELDHFDAREWLHRAQSGGVAVEYVDQVLVRRRIHRDNRSRQREHRTRAEMLLVAEKLLARRRAAGLKQ